MDFKFEDMEMGGVGLDAFFASEPAIISPHGQKVAVEKKAAPRVKVGSLSALSNFRRISSETLIHKSTNDLWSLHKEGDGYYIERLFQDDGQPLKG